MNTCLKVGLLVLAAMLLWRGRRWRVKVVIACSPAWTRSRLPGCRCRRGRWCWRVKAVATWSPASRGPAPKISKSPGCIWRVVVVMAA